MFTRKPTTLTSSGIFVDPFALLGRMASEFDRTFEEPDWPAFRTRGTTESAAWSPSLDVFEKDNRLVARVDLPGIKREDVKVEVANGYLTISGERKHESEERKENVYRWERAHGAFHRSIPLPDGVTLDGVRAVFENGVLEVTVPLAAGADAKSRTITIEESAKPARVAA